MRRTLKKLSLILLMSLASAGAYAETGGGVTMSTDPAKAAAVEKHAQELQAQQSKEAASKPAPAHASSKNAKSEEHQEHQEDDGEGTRDAQVVDDQAVLDDQACREGAPELSLADGDYGPQALTCGPRRRPALRRLLRDGRSRPGAQLSL